MNRINLDDKTSQKKKKKVPSYSIDNAENMTVEELMKSIKTKIRRIQDKNGNG